jgi:hypothetical protein
MFVDEITNTDTKKGVLLLTGSQLRPTLRRSTPNHRKCHHGPNPSGEPSRLLYRLRNRRERMGRDSILSVR